MEDGRSARRAEGEEREKARLDGQDGSFCAGIRRIGGVVG